MAIMVMSFESHDHAARRYRDAARDGR